MLPPLLRILALAVFLHCGASGEGNDDEGAGDSGIDPATPAPTAVPTKLAFVAHHGLLARSYHHVIETHQQFAFDVLARNGYRIETFVHTWDLKTPINNPRAQEPAVIVAPAEEVLKRVPYLTSYLVEDQATSLEGRVVRDYVFNSWLHDQPQTQANYVRALVSASRVTQLMVARANETGREPDLVVFLRPDIMLAGPLPVDRELFEVNGICWRRKQKRSSRELGDRLMYGSFRAMQAYGMRINIATSQAFKQVARTCFDLAECAADFSIAQFESRGCPMPETHLARVRADGRLNHLDRIAMVKDGVPLGKWSPAGRQRRRPHPWGGGKWAPVSTPAVRKYAMQRFLAHHRARPPLRARERQGPGAAAAHGWAGAEEGQGPGPHPHNRGWGRGSAGGYLSRYRERLGGRGHAYRSRRSVPRGPGHFGARRRGREIV